MDINVTFKDGSVKECTNVKHFKAERNFSIVFNNSRKGPKHVKQFPLQEIESVEVLDVGNPISYYESLWQKEV